MGDGVRAHVSHGLEQACVTGAVPPPHRLRGRLRRAWAWDQALDAARKPYPCTASSRWLQGRPGGSFKPLEVSLQHRPPSPSARCRHEAADLAGGYPLRIVRIAPLHDAGITVSRSCTPRSLLSGRSYTLMHAEELRAGHARSSFHTKRTHHAYTFCSCLSSHFTPFALSEVEGRFPACFDFAQHERY